MQIFLGNFSQKSRKWLRTGWLTVAGLTALYVGAIQPYENARSIAEQKSTGLGAVAWDPVALWRPSLLSQLLQTRPAPASPMVVGVVAGGIAAGDGNVAQANLIADATVPAPPPPPPDALYDRKMVRTTEMDLIVKSPAETVVRVRQITEQVGGFLVTSEINGEQDANSASLTVRVPGARFEEVQQALPKLAVRVESEKVNAEDVTRQYVDEEASLRNLHAQEMQYLGILKQAKTVKDTLEVSQQLNGIHGQIERQQAEHEALSKQVETVAITVSLRAEADAQVFGLHWRPLYQLKLSAREGLDGLGSYVAAMVAFGFYLPTVLLWLMTILIGAAIGWRILRWAARTFFARPKVA